MEGWKIPQNLFLLGPRTIVEVLEQRRAPQDDVASGGECQQIFIVEFDHPWISGVGFAQLAGCHLDYSNHKGYCDGMACSVGQFKTIPLGFHALTGIGSVASVPQKTRQSLNLSDS